MNAPDPGQSQEIRSGNPALSQNAGFIQEHWPAVYRQLCPYLKPNAIRITQEEKGRTVIHYYENEVRQRSISLTDPAIQSQSARRIDFIRSQLIRDGEGFILHAFLHLRELIELVGITQKSLHGLIVAEPDPLRLTGMLMQQDITGILQLPWTALFTGGMTKEEIREILEQRGLGYFESWRTINSPSGNKTRSLLLESIQETLRGIQDDYLRIERSMRTLYPSRPCGSPRRVLIVDSWRKCPGSLHLQAIDAALKKRGIETRRLTIDRIDEAPHSFYTLTGCYRYWLLPVIHEFRPDWILSNQHHSHQFLGEKLYAEIALPWIVIQSSLYPGKPPFGPQTVLFAADQTLIPLMQKKGAFHTFFLPLAANYYLPDPPAETELKYPVTVVGGCTFPSPDKFQRFREVLRPYGEIYDRLHALAEQRIRERTFFTKWDMEEDSILEPLPAALRDEAAQFLFWWVGGAWRLESALTLQDRGLAVFGYNWPNIAPKRFIEKCWKGVFQDPRLAQSIYRQSRICLNSLSPGNLSGPNMSYFNIPASGCMLLTNEGPQFPDYYDRSREIAVFSDPESLVNAADVLLGNPRDTREKARQSNLRTVREHLFEHRVDEILRRIQILFG